MILRRTLPAVLILLLALATPGLCAGQDVERRALEQRAKTGDRLTILTADGTQFRGRLASLDQDALVLTDRGVQRRVSYRDVERVQRRKNGIILGAVIGTAAGLAAGLALGTYLENEAREGGPAVTALTLAGLGIGVGLDALMVVDRTIYRRPSARATFTVTPMKGGAAIGWTATW